MDLLQEIIDAAVDSSCDLGMLLRKCKVLAASLGSTELEDWLIWESNGYPDDAQVPDYRIWKLEVKGHFLGPAGSGMKNAPIPSTALPDHIRDSYLNYQCKESIAGIETALEKADGGVLAISTGDLAVALAGRVFKYLNCVQAWAEYGSGSLVEVLNSVRNRILDFALAIEKEQSKAGHNGGPVREAIGPSLVTQIFHTTVYGGAANVIGSSSGLIITYNGAPNDFDALRGFFVKNGLPNPEIDELETILKTEPSPTKAGEFGPRVSTWIAKVVTKAAEGSWKIGVGAAGGLLAQAIAKYYGV